MFVCLGYFFTYYFPGFYYPFYYYETFENTYSSFLPAMLIIETKSKPNIIELLNIIQY